MKYYVELSPYSLLITLEVPMTIPAHLIFGEGNVSFDNIVLYQRTYIKIEKDIINTNWYIPAPLLVDENVPDVEPSLNWGRVLGYTGLVLCAIVAVPAAIALVQGVGATGLATLGLGLVIPYSEKTYNLNG